MVLDLYDETILKAGPALYLPMPPDEAGATFEDAASGNDGTGSGGYSRAAGPALPGFPDSDAVALDGSTGKIVAAVPATRQQLHGNPRAAVDLAGLADSGSPTVTRVTGVEADGLPEGITTAVNVVGNSGGDRVWRECPVESGKTYTGQMRVRLNSSTGSGNDGVRILLQTTGGTNKASSDSVTVPGASFVLLHVTWVADFTGNLRVCSQQTGGTFDADWDWTMAGWEEADEVLPYFDGDGYIDGSGLWVPNTARSQPCAFVGADHDSASDKGLYARGSARTWELWARRDSTSTQDALLGGDIGFAAGALLVNLNTGGTNVSIFPAGNGTTQLFASAWPADSDWHHAAVVFDQAAETLALYVDGELAAEKTGVTAQLTPGQGAVVLGGYTAGTANPLDGGIAKPAVYEYGLSAATIRRHHRLGVRGGVSLALLRERPSWRALEVTRADGELVRFGPDENDPRDTLDSWEFGTTMPGGFADGSAVVPRPPSLRADDARLFASARVYGPDGTDYEGRVVGVPQVGSDHVRLTLEGHVAELDDDKSFRRLYVQRDLTAWEAMSTSRRVLLYGLGRHFGGFAREPDAAGAPSLALDASGRWSESHFTVEAVYNAGDGILLGKADYGWTAQGVNIATWLARLQGMDDDISAGEVNGTDQITSIATSGSRVGETSIDGKPVAFFQLYFGGTSGADVERRWTVRNVALFGRGLTIRGDYPNRGLYASDIVYDAVTKATGLKATLGGSIAQSDYIVLQAVYDQPKTTARAPVESMAAFGHGNVPNDWGVYERREFFWLPPGTYGRTWRVRRDQVASPESDGPDAERRIAGIQITYRDVVGRAFTVGPPGSGSSYETALLQDNDPSNPAAGTNRIDHEEVGIMDRAGALLVGRIVLAARNRLNWRGSIEVVGYPRDSAGIERPASLMRAGDRVLVEDGDRVEEHTIHSTSYSHDDLRATVHIGAPPDTTPTLLARLDAAASLVGA